MNEAIRAVQMRDCMCVVTTLCAGVVTTNMISRIRRKILEVFIKTKGCEVCALMNCSEPGMGAREQTPITRNMICTNKTSEYSFVDGRLRHVAVSTFTYDPSRP